MELSSLNHLLPKKKFTNLFAVLPVETFSDVPELLCLPQRLGAARNIHGLVLPTSYNISS